MDLLCGKWRWHLLDHPTEASRDAFHLIRTEGYILRLARRFAFRVVGIGRETEPDHPFISFFRRDIELRQAGKVAGYQRQDSGSHGIERSHMPDRSLSENAPHSIHHVVRGEPRRLIDDENAVHARVS